ncbi:MAG: twin-arginine translocase TatA/TatE family subunit [Rubrobacteraceae bacterium]
MIPGGPEVLIILGVVVLLFGAKRIPELARSLGSGAREFRQGLTGENEGNEEERIETLSASEKHEVTENAPVADSEKD